MIARFAFRLLAVAALWVAVVCVVMAYEFGPTPLGVIAWALVIVFAAAAGALWKGGEDAA